jgi:hypothetical protein
MNWLKNKLSRKRDDIQNITKFCPYSPKMYFLYYYLCTRVQALRLCTGRTAHRESRGSEERRGGRECG